MWYMLPLIIKILKLEQFKYRGLTQGEIQLCQKVFAQLIDYQKVRIMNQPYLLWQPTYMFMAPEGNLHIQDPYFKSDYSKENINYQSIFIHEMTHILQFQQHTNVLLKGAILQIAYFISFKCYNPYKYTFKAGKKFSHYNIEQQGDIAKDIFLQKIPNIILCD